MSRSTRFFCAMIMVLTIIAAPASALAAPAGWRSVDVTLHNEEQQSKLIVSGELPSDAKLPYETELAVPAGMELSWIGEILGGPVADDPSLTYAKSTVGDTDVYRFTLTKSRIAQIEGDVQGVSSFDGTSYSAALKWTAWQEVPEVRMSMVLPAAAKIGQPAADAVLGVDASGNGLYSKTVKKPRTGDVLDLTFAYTAPAVPASTPDAAAGSGSNTVLTVILTLMAVGFVMLLVSVWRKIAGKTSDSAPGERPHVGHEESVGGFSEDGE